MGTPTWDWGKSLCFQGFAARIPSGYWGCPLASAQCPGKLSFLFDVEGRTFSNLNCAGEEELLGFMKLFPSQDFSNSVSDIIKSTMGVNNEE